MVHLPPSARVETSDMSYLSIAQILYIPLTALQNLLKVVQRPYFAALQAILRNYLCCRWRDSASPSFSHGPTMLIERLYLPLIIEVDKNGISLVAAACSELNKGPVMVDKLWPGELRDLPS